MADDPDRGRRHGQGEGEGQKRSSCQEERV